jgi:putative transposase
LFSEAALAGGRFMPPRVVVPNLPHHIVQRGHNRSAVFVQPRDYRTYLKNLRELRDRFGCRVYAFCLMTNHVHLVIDPGNHAPSLARLMKHLSARYTRYVNRLENRTGTAWESRYRSSPIDSEPYLLACTRYVELNPLRAGLATSPERYQWSSFRERAGFASRRWLDEDPCYREFGSTRAARAARYRHWTNQSVPRGEWSMIRTAVRRGRLTGDSRFVDEIERRTGQRVEPRPQGRPRKRKHGRGRENRSDLFSRSRDAGRGHPLRVPEGGPPSASFVSSRVSSGSHRFSTHHSTIMVMGSGGEASARQAVIFSFLVNSVLKCTGSNS